MKKFYLTLIFIVLMILIFGIGAPMLISAKHTELVAAGFILIASTPLIGYQFYKIYRRI